MRPWGRAYWPAGFLVLAAALTVAHLCFRPDLGREHDAWAHLQYLQLIRDSDTLPAAQSCAQCYQPPLWYWSSAMLAALFRVDDASLGRFVSILGAFYHLIFLAFAFAAVRLRALPWKSELACLLMIAFWPSGPVAAIQVGNDPLLYALWGGTTFFFLRWLSSTKRPYDGPLAALLMVLCWSTKENAAIPWLACTLTLAMLPWKRETATAWLGSALGFAVWTANRYRLGSFWPVANADFVLNINPQLRVSNSVPHLVGLNPSEFLAPYVSPWVDAGGRQYVLSYLLKTSVSGELSSTTSGHSELNQLLNVLVLIGSGAVILAMVRAFRSADRGMRHSAILVCVSIGAIWANRFIVPVATSADFRYVYPSLIPAVLLLGWWVESHSKKHRRSASVFLTLAAVFGCASLLSSWIFVR